MAIDEVIEYAIEYKETLLGATAIDTFGDERHHIVPNA